MSIKKPTRRCEGWRRRGGAFTIGPPLWEQCKEDATCMITIKDLGRIPACHQCWKEATDPQWGVVITKVEPI